MARAALRLLGFLLGAALLRAAGPTPIANVRIGRVEYVRATDVAARLGLKVRYEGAKRLLLSDGAHHLEVPAPGATDLKEISLDGLKIFLGDPTVVRAGQLYFSRIDFEHRLLPLLRPAASPPPPSVHVIAIDPGHGGSDNGTQNPRLHLMEKTFTLDVGLRLRKLLEAQGYQVVMTRTNDSRFANDPKVDLPLRAEFANTKHADLFLSIHFNAGGTASDVSSHGTEVYTFPPEHQRATASWGSGVDDGELGLASVVRFNAWSVLFAHAMHEELHRRLGTEDRGERLRHLGVLRPLNCPGILVESAFLTNDAEGRRVATPAFRQEMAEAMLAGIHAYVAAIDSLRPGAAHGMAPAAAHLLPAVPAAPESAPPKGFQPPRRPS